MSSTGSRPTARDRVSRDRDIAELERRIELLERLDESIPGNFTRWDWGVCVLGAVIVPCLPFALWPQNLYDLSDAFLAYNGTMYAPISGILFADYFVIRRQRLSLWSIFDDARDGAYEYVRGFNVPALACVLLGQVLYLWLYNPMSGETHDLLLRVLSPSLTAFFVPGMVYLVAMRFAGSLRPSASAPERPGASTGRLVAPNL